MNKDYYRKYVVVTTGHRRLFGDKRPYPKDEKCELCNRKRYTHFKMLLYHHWDDNDLSKGLWLCNNCHNILTFFVIGIKLSIEDLIPIETALFLEDNPNILFSEINFDINNFLFEN